MDSEKTLTNLALYLAFWAVIVLLLLLSNGELSDRAIATPIASDIAKQDLAAITIDTPEIISPAATATILSGHTEISGKIEKGESFDQAMKRLGVSDSARIAIIRGFDGTLDFRSLQPGDRFTVLFDQNNSLVKATYASGPLHTYILAPEGDGTMQASKQDVPLLLRVERLAGVIESSLYSAFAETGEEPKLIHAYADIFASKVDFNTETMAGDRFELLVEKYFKDNEFIGYGRILFASYQAGNKKFQGYQYASDQTPPGYFDENGEALGTWFIRSPLPLGRVTSRFTMRRKHPVDGVVRPHLGVDLAAPRGTQVMATADGKVEFIGRKGGFGKTIILRHHGGYKTYYGHLNGYKKGLKKGSTVAQKDVIGYVGSTGISTGPHLDYRIKENGVFKNPFGIKFKAKTVLQDEELALFHRHRTRMASQLNSSIGEKILQVRNVILYDSNTISFL